MAGDMYVPRGIAALARGGAIAAAALMFAAGHAHADTQQIYFNDFEAEGALSEWSNNLLSTTPIGNRSFLGEFSNESVMLTLTDLPVHDTLVLTFDFYAIRTWDGDTEPGPDEFGVEIVGGPVLLHSSFTVTREGGWRTQDYPGSFGSEESNPARTGAIENNTLGYTWQGVPVDAVWRFTLAGAHSESTATIRFWAANLQPIDDESWGLDNVSVSTVVVPAPGAAAILGMTGLLATRRRRR